MVPEPSLGWADSLSFGGLYGAQKVHLVQLADRVAAQIRSSRLQ